MPVQPILWPAMNVCTLRKVIKMCNYSNCLASLRFEGRLRPAWTSFKNNKNHWFQLLKTNRSKSLSLCEDLRSSASGSRNEPGHQSPSPPNASRISTRNRKRGNRTASLGSSSDEGSLMNLSMSSSDGRTAEGETYQRQNQSDCPMWLGLVRISVVKRVAYNNLKKQVDHEK